MGQFKLAKDKHQAWFNANADFVIKKLNRDFAKPVVLRRRKMVLLLRI